MTQAAPIVGLVRQWSVDWLNGRHPEVCDKVLSDDYTLRIGGFLLGPRSTYVPATLEQLERYPGLVVTVHQLVTDGDRVALAFSEHGASARLGGRSAVWSGIALFGWDGSKLSRCFAEEDYSARRRQLDDGECDPVMAPAAAPWDQPARPSDPRAEQVVRDWLAEPDLRSAPVTCDDEHTGRAATRLLDVERCEIHECFSAGDQVAFHVAQVGAYVGDLDGIEGIGSVATLESAGIVTVRDGRVVSGRVVRDRLGLARALSTSSTGQPAST